MASENRQRLFWVRNSHNHALGLSGVTNQLMGHYLPQDSRNCAMQTMCCKTDNGPENHCQVTFRCKYPESLRELPRLHRSPRPGGTREGPVGFGATPGPNLRDPLHRRGLPAPSRPTRCVRADEASRYVFIAFIASCISWSRNKHR